MSVLETILYFVVPAVGIYVLIALLVAAPKMSRRQRYRLGQPWPYEPLFWTANPEGAHLGGPEHADPEHAAPDSRASGARVDARRGGARGNW